MQERASPAGANRPRAPMAPSSIGAQQEHSRTDEEDEQPQDCRRTERQHARCADPVANGKRWTGSARNSRVVFAPPHRERVPGAKSGRGTGAHYPYGRDRRSTAPPAGDDVSFAGYRPSARCVERSRGSSGYKAGGGTSLAAKARIRHSRFAEARSSAPA